MFDVANMSFNVIRENKVIAKIFGITVASFENSVGDQDWHWGWMFFIYKTKPWW